MEIKETKLEVFKFTLAKAISKRLVESFAIPAKVMINEHSPWGSDWYVVRITQKILGEQLAQESIQAPADWWQAVKERFAPGWCKRRWPIRYITKTLKARALYPKLGLPNESHHIAFLVDTLND